MKWNLVCSAVVPSPRDVLPGVLLDPHHLADLLLHLDDPHHQESQQECGEKICVQRKQQDWQIHFSQTSSWQQETDHQNVRWELFKWETVLNIHFQFQWVLSFSSSLPGVLSTSRDWDMSTSRTRRTSELSTNTWCTFQVQILRSNQITY